MTLTEAQLSEIRFDVGDPGGESPVFSGTELGDLETRAAAEYTEASVILAEIKRLCIRRLMIDSAKMTTYRIATSSENLSDIFKHLKEMYKLFTAERDDLIADDLPAAKIARPKKVRDVPRGKPNM